MTLNSKCTRALTFQKKKILGTDTFSVPLLSTWLTVACDHERTSDPSTRHERLETLNLTLQLSNAQLSRCGTDNDHDEVCLYICIYI